MKRGVLCVIEPPAHVHDELKYQFAGLIVTTASPTLPAGYWSVLPSPYVKATFDWHDARGFLCRAGDPHRSRAARALAAPHSWRRAPFIVDYRHNGTGDSMRCTVAVLFAETNGAYFGLPGVDPWDQARDARKYAGPHPVVAHPPCDRWCQMAPVNQARYGHRVGDDGGCFAAALSAVRNFGGVLEHPALSLAWRTFGLPRPPAGGGWARTMCGGWTCHVEQRHYGHRARKATWLLAYGLEPPPLKWGAGPAPEAWISADRPRAELAAMGIAQLSKKEAKATPPAFRDVLLDIARRCSVADTTTPTHTPALA